jgi:DNA repair protein RadC
MGEPDWPGGEAPREKLHLRGAGALSDVELLAALIGSGVAGRPVGDLARGLLRTYGGLRPLLRASPAELCRERGMGRARCAQFIAALELARRSALEGLDSKQALTNPAGVVDFLAHHLAHRRREVFCCLFLDAQHRLISCEDMFSGTLDGAAVYPREVVARALQIGAAAVICAHNHPSGIAEPSAADRRITDRLAAALGLLDMRLLDHVIIGEGCWYSFAEHGQV